MRVGERSGVEAAEMSASANLAADQAGPLERLEMLGGGGERNRKRRGELADRSLPARELAQHPPAGRIAERVEDDIEAFRRRMFNHMVEYDREREQSQPIG